MKTLLSLVWVLAATTGFAAAATNDLGSWSEPVHGISCRIVFGDPTTNGNWRAMNVYLEVKNVSGFIDDISFTFDPMKSVSFTLVDHEGKPIPECGRRTNGKLRPTSQLSIPNGGSLKLPVTWNWHSPIVYHDGNAANRNRTTISFVNQMWAIPTVSKTNAYLHCVFRPVFSSDLPRPLRLNPIDWDGTIQLPRVAVPLAMSLPE